MTERALILGGTGFIGRHLVAGGLSRGWAVSSVSLRGAPTLNVESSAVDLTSATAAQAFFSGRAFDYIINASGYIDHRPYLDGGRALIDQHLAIVLNVAQYADRSSLKAFIQLGSSDEYGSNRAPQSEEMREAPIAPYSFAKVAAGHFLQMLHTTEGFPATMIRIFLAYGPGQDSRRFLPQIISGCLQEKPFPTSAGEQLRDFCYIDDVVRGVLMACECPAAVGEVINVASGQPVTIRKMIEMVQSKIGRGHPEFGKVAYRKGENMALYASAEKAKRLLGWAPTVSLEEGLARTIEYYKQAEKGTHS